MSRNGDGYRVETDTGSWEADAVVVASGAFNAPRVPAISASLPAALDQVTPLDYKRPDQLREGRVLVVGASATGLQLADELLRSGREVTIAVGEHVRMPRTYRGRDIMWWLEKIGRLDERYDEVDDLVRARHVPSPQLVGTPDRADLDLNALTDAGRLARRSPRGRKRRHRVVLRLAAQRLQPRRPQAQASPEHDRRVGRHRLRAARLTRRGSTSTRGS